MGVTTSESIRRPKARKCDLCGHTPVMLAMQGSKWVCADGCPAEPPEPEPEPDPASLIAHDPFSHKSGTSKRIIGELQERGWRQTLTRNPLPPTGKVNEVIFDDSSPERDSYRASFVLKPVDELVPDQGSLDPVLPLDEDLWEPGQARKLGAANTARVKAERGSSLFSRRVQERLDGGDG